MRTKKRITIHDVARASGVSVSTVSKALNGSGRMNGETRARVVRVAKELSFRPNALARGLLSRRSFTVGLLTNDSQGRFTLPVMEGITDALSDQTVSVFLCSVRDDPELTQRHIDAMLDKQVDGIIVAGRQVDLSFPVDLSALPVPVVRVMTAGDADGVSIMTDDYQGAKLAIDYLMELGRKRIIHITGEESFTSARDRADAFFDLVGPEADVLFGDWSESWGYEAARQIWSGQGDKPDAAFCGNDQIARGVLDALRELRIDVPDDVAVIGYDNWEAISAHTRPPLTTIDMQLTELGRQAGLAMLALTNGALVDPLVQKLPCRLIKRQSCEWNPAPDPI